MLKRAMVFIFFLNLMIGKCYAQELDIRGIFSEVSKFGKISLVISNVGSSYESEKYLDALIEETLKRNISSRNLFLLNGDHRKTTFLALYIENSGKVYYFDASGKRSVIQVSLEEISKNPEDWEKKIKERVFNGNEYSIASIVAVFQNLPYELKRAVEFHDHICPGLVTGYHISNFLKSKMTEQERLFVFAIPPFCKYDAIQVILNATAGKRLIYARNMTKEESKLYPHLAGIYVFWDEKKKRGRGFMLSFNMAELRAQAGIEEGVYPWLWRLRLLNFMLKNSDIVMGKIRLIKEFSVDETMLERMKLSEFRLTEL